MAEVTGGGLVARGNDGGWGQIRNSATSLPYTRVDLMTDAVGGRDVTVSMATSPR